ncbi:hypothetical protein ACFL2Q_01895 [Thermodesulfobacteriota bacterium]
MTDYREIHDRDWLEAILPGDNPNTIKVVTRMTDGSKRVYRVAKEPLLERMQRVDAIREKKKKARQG